MNVSIFNETTTGAVGINRVVKPFSYAKFTASNTPPNQPPILNPTPVSIDTFFAAYDVPVNNRYIKNNGIEYGIDLPEIKAIKTSFNITGAYIQTISYDDGVFTDAVKAYASNTTPARIGIYQSGTKIKAERLNTSVRFIHRIPQLNLILSALWQTIWITKSGNEPLSEFATGFVNRKGETILLSENDAKLPVNNDLKRAVSNAVPISLPALHLFNPNYALAILKGYSKSFEYFHKPLNHALLFLLSAILSTSLSSIFSKYAPTAKVLYRKVDSVLCVFS